MTRTFLPEQLADVDSRFLKLGSLRLHFKEAGAGFPALILLHGFGASLFSWQKVFAPLARSHRVVAYDRPGFGLTTRPLPGQWLGPSPYGPEAQVQLLFDMMRSLEIPRAVLVGNSQGGEVAAMAALQEPTLVRALVLVDAAIGPMLRPGLPPGWVLNLLRLPVLRKLGRYLVRPIARQGDSILRRAWHDPSRITQEVLEGYRKPLRVSDWDMALWEFTLAWRSGHRRLDLERLEMPTLVMSGDDDHIVPATNSRWLARSIPGATLEVIAHCGHLPQEEQPAEFLRVLEPFLAVLHNSGHNTILPGK